MWQALRLGASWIWFQSAARACRRGKKQPFSSGEMCFSLAKRDGVRYQMIETDRITLVARYLPGQYNVNGDDELKWTKPIESIDLNRIHCWALE